MVPLIAGAAIAAGSAVAGGLLGQSAAKKQAKQEMAAQKEFAQHGVRWRVEDAKAAGLHPLYALGAQLPTYAPSFTANSGAMGQALSEAGQHIGRAVQAGQTSTEKQLTQLQLALAGKQLDEADARIGALNAEAFRNYNEGLASTSFPNTTSGLGIVPEGQAPRVGAGLTNVVPTTSPTVSQESTGIMAGSPPLWREFDTGAGFKVLLPGGVSGDAAEALEAVGENDAVLAGVIAVNTARYGGRWIQRFQDWVGPLLSGERGAMRMDSLSRERPRRIYRQRRDRYSTGGGF